MKDDTIRDIAIKKTQSVYDTIMAIKSPLPITQTNNNTNKNPLDLDFILYDNEDKNTLWGIDQYTKNIDLNKILIKFHKDKECRFCKSSTVIIDVVDSNPKNFLISNLDWVCKDCFLKHYEQSTPMQVTKEFTFDAAHSLLFYTGKCSYTHGHTFKLVLTIEKILDKMTGMVEDFSTINTLVNKWVIEPLDHNDLNNVLPPGTKSTAEILVLWIWKILAQKALLKGIFSIDLYETSTNKITITKDTMLTYIYNNISSSLIY